jgi:hypothetical protein
MSCECWFHRYHVVHTIVGDPVTVYAHDQFAWDTALAPALRAGQTVETWPSEQYRHRETADELRERLDPRPPTLLDHNAIQMEAAKRDALAGEIARIGLVACPDGRFYWVRHANKGG